MKTRELLKTGFYKCENCKYSDYIVFNNHEIHYCYYGNCNHIFIKKEYMKKCENFTLKNN